MSPSAFDRLAERNRNRRLRNIAMTLAGVMFLITALVGLDPVVQGTGFRAGPVLLLGTLCFIFFVLGVYFHMRYLSRE